MPSATTTRAKNPDGRGPSSAIPSSVVSTSPAEMYNVRRNRLSVSADTGETIAPTMMMPPNQVERASTYTYRNATTRSL